jgi:hypothetical protein
MVECRRGVSICRAAWQNDPEQDINAVSAPITGQNPTFRHTNRHPIRERSTIQHFVIASLRGNDFMQVGKYFVVEPDIRNERNRAYVM